MTGESGPLLRADLDAGNSPRTPLASKAKRLLRGPCGRSAERNGYGVVRFTPNTFLLPLIRRDTANQTTPLSPNGG